MELSTPCTRTLPPRARRPWTRWVRLPVLAALLSLTRDLYAQDSSATKLVPIRVTVTRDVQRSTLELPFGVSRLSIDSARIGARRASLTELLIAVPGLAVSNRHNPTQDPRLAIRGFGARAAFGIRGVRVMRDGVPLTLADGQTAVDFVDLEAVGSAEVLRGAAGALYGNASGGVLELRTEAPPAEGLRARARGFVNEDAARTSVHAAGRTGGLGWQGTISRNTGDGPREYARSRSTSAFGDVTKEFGDNMFLRAQLTLYDSPLAENPGAVTIAELEIAPWVADSQNIRRKASKTVNHRMLSVQGERTWSAGAASATAFGGTRDLANPQAFALVEFERRMMGASARVQHSGVIRNHLWRLSFGSDLLSMRDDRHNFTNCAANPAPACTGLGDRGPETVSQVEKVESAGIFGRGELSRSWLTVTGTIRGDHTGFTVRDRRITSVPGGSILSLNMGAVTPMVGVTVRPGPTWSAYASVAGSFETPTTTELANQPDGSSGINRELKPQHGRTAEVGVKGIIGTRVLFDVSVFDIETTDELIPFEIPNSGGRRYFRNAGKTSRQGVEVGATAALGPLMFGAAFTKLDYEYDEFSVGTTVLNGRKVPGVAPSMSSFYLTGRQPFGFATIEVQQAARTAADDANANHAPGYAVWNARAGYTSRGVWGIEPVVGIENIFNRTYVANVVTNATRGRFFEPGAGRRVYAALSAKITR
jgi:iron complex outermembrane recepter protein